MKSFNMKDGVRIRDNYGNEALEIKLYPFLINTYA